MRTLARTALAPTEAWEPLGWNFPQLQSADIVPMRSMITMLAAGPSAGKTFLVLKWIQMMKNEPTLFFSADTDPQTIIARAAAIATGHPQSEIRRSFAADEGGREYYAEVLAEHYGHVRWVWESDPTYRDLALETAAFAEAFGEPPRVIVLDTLMNVVGENESEWQAMRESTKALHRLVRITGAAVFLLHHMSENSADPSKPPPRRDVQGKVNQIPEVIISLAASDDGTIRACAVKNRVGAQSIGSKSWVEIPVDLDTGQFWASRHAKDTGMLPL